MNVLSFLIGFFLGLCAILTFGSIMSHFAAKRKKIIQEPHLEIRVKNLAYETIIGPLTEKELELILKYGYGPEQEWMEPINGFLCVKRLVT